MCLCKVFAFYGIIEDMKGKTMVERKEYINKLRSLKNMQIIKIVTGIRRCGKSTLLEMFRDELTTKDGVDKKQITYLNFEDEVNAKLKNRKELYQYLKSRIIDDKMNYVFLDEIQNVPEFERVVDSFFIHKNIDIYITGSNAHLLSSDLATHLSGRYIEIKMLPFSFSEYVESFGDTTNLTQRFNDYIYSSSLPFAATLQAEHPEQVKGYLDGIYESVLQKDIFLRHKIIDKHDFNAVVKFVFDSIGSTISPYGISKAMKQTNKTIDNRTVNNYLLALTESFVLYPVSRYDIKGKQLLRTQEKYYLVDLGLRQLLLGNKPHSDLGHLLENVIYFELIRRENQVFIGKTGNKEVDFIAKSPDGNISYYQVAYSVMNEATLKRELAPLQQIQATDNYPKYLITMDSLSFDNAGIKHINALDFLIGKEK